MFVCVVWVFSIEMWWFLCFDGLICYSEVKKSNCWKLQLKNYNIFTYVYVNIWCFCVNVWCNFCTFLGFRGIFKSINKTMSHYEVINSHVYFILFQNKFLSKKPYISFVLNLLRLFWLEIRLNIYRSWTL